MFFEGFIVTDRPASPRPRVRPAPPGMAARRRSRRKAVQALYQAQINPCTALELEAQFMEEPDILKADLEHFRRLLQGILASRAELDALIAPLVSRPLVDVDPIEHAILWVGAFELRDCLDLPYRVVINESIELAKMFGAQGSHGFVNGVLDKLAPTLRAAELGAARG
ncbi:MAG: transcription antitermination factor NusB [Halothiobacillaceae bacterium]|nr:MAG: transcription antitermination factor NusB [Halothiobacillaceae bacterium]